MENEPVVVNTPDTPNTTTEIIVLFMGGAQVHRRPRKIIRADQYCIEFVNSVGDHLTFWNVTYLIAVGVQQNTLAEA